MSTFASIRSRDPGPWLTGLLRGDPTNIAAIALAPHGVVLS
jgi:hypothetical protein